MKQLNTRLRVDIDLEIAAMAAYIGPRYNHLTHPEAFFQRVYCAAVKDAPLWFDQGPVFDAFVERLKKRTELLGDGQQPERRQIRHDAPSQLLSNMPATLSTLHQVAQDLTGKWDFTKRTRAAFYLLLEECPYLSDVRPLGWAAARRRYVEHGDMERYANTGQLRDEAAFDGHDSSGAGAGGFTMQTALTSIMYGDVSQNRKAPYGFLAAAYGHFLRLIAHNNMVDMVAAFEQLDLGDTVVGTTFDLPTTLTSGNALLDTAIEKALKDCMGAKDLQEMKEADDLRQLERSRMSTEERASEDAAKKARVLAFMKSTFAKPIDADTEARWKAEHLACRDSLLARAKLTAPI